METPPPSNDAVADAIPDTTPPVPAVVAVVVARDPGAWFEEVLASLVAQDYPNLSLLVVDANSAVAVKERVTQAAPDALVYRLAHDHGFGASVNEALGLVEGAGFYFCCHDDVASESGAIRLLVEEAFRSNAAVVGPKLVDWDDPHRLLQVGQGMDHAGFGVPLVERGELDQSQHDAVRDVFTIPGACTLVRADLFDEIGGFDEGIDDFLDDVSLCWRAQIAGARVVIAPVAVARHGDVLALTRGLDERRRLQARHRLHILLTCYGPLALLRTLPQIILIGFLEITYALLAGRRKRAGDVVFAWTWNLRRPRALHAARQQVKGFRHVSDRQVGRSMVRGSARVSQFLRGQIGRGGDRFTDLARGSREVAGAWRSGSLRASVWAGVVVALVLLAGSRHLITRGVPAIGEMVRFSSSPVDLLRVWAGGWRSAGLGSDSPTPTALGLLGGAGFTVIGAMGLLRTIVIVGLIPLGALGAYRLAGPIGSRYAQIACLVVYVTIPLPYNALANGRWGALGLYAAAPTLLGMLARASELSPFGAAGGAAGPGWRPQSLGGHILGIGLVTAILAALLPVAPLIVVAMALALVIGSLLAMGAQRNRRILLSAMGGAGLAIALHLPWSLGFVRPGASLSALVGPERAAVPSDLAALLRFQVGPLGSAPIGWCFLGAALLPLLIGRGPRYAWAVRGWTLAVASFAAAWAAQRGNAPIALPPVEVLLAPAAIGLALAVAMGMAAFEVDLPGYRFGWRQVASAGAAMAVVVGVIPVLGASFNGRWLMPSSDHQQALRFIDTENDQAPFRVLWVGDPAVLPLGSWRLDDGLGYGTTSGGAPGLEDLWVGSDDGPTGLIADALDLAREGQTTRLGRLLGPMGVQYLVVPEALAPFAFGTEAVPVPAEFSAALAAQLDLVRIDIPAGLTVYRNEAFVPPLAILPPGTTLPVNGGIDAALGLDLSGLAPALPTNDGYQQHSGPVPDDASVFQSAASSPHWVFEVDGVETKRTEPFGWASSFAAPSAGTATLRYVTSPVRYGLLALEVMAWLWVVRSLLRRRQGMRTAWPTGEAPAADQGSVLA
ncbi:MAG: glycosyltransferase family 2 protein [Acidimicrobiia bacterium]|nr:glycosyltransferase family 2 protein [Acidimicrobiia bacterium]